MPLQMTSRQVGSDPTQVGRLRDDTTVGVSVVKVRTVVSRVRRQPTPASHQDDGGLSGARVSSWVETSTISAMRVQSGRASPSASCIRAGNGGHPVTSLHVAHESQVKPGQYLLALSERVQVQPQSHVTFRKVCHISWREC